MRTVALLVHPNGEIFAVDELQEVRESMHSGYIDEEREIMANYRRRQIEYKEKVQSADKCNQQVALEVLAEQYPDRELPSDSIQRYNVKNILLRELLGKRRRKFTVGEKVPCVNDLPLPGNTIGPPLKKGEVYPVIEIYVDPEGNQHLHVGLESNYEYVRAYEMGGDLPRGNEIHWCHPTRFE